MKNFTAIIALVFASGCSSTQYLYKGQHEGVDISYRWNHPKGKPSELLLKLTNTAAEDKQVDLSIDLYIQGRTVETLQADTCIRAGQTMNGKINGIYFVPERLTTAHIKEGGTQVEMTNTGVTSAICQ